MAEDCLYLNVTAPAGALSPGPAGRPVLLWIHGGGFEMGHGPDLAGDGAAFARSHGLVVVTFNYRLGALGFLDVPGENPTGAFGLHDQIAALRWTRENIAAFGGDPEQITVYGLSAGGKSVTSLLASPLTKGLIRRAAESSGGDHVKNPEQVSDLAGRYFRTLAATPQRIALSDRVCAGLQVVEHLQDIAEDHARGRVYMPQEDLVRFGCKDVDLVGEAVAPRSALVAFEADRARRLLGAGAPLARTLAPRPRLAIAGFVAGGRTALDVLQGAARAPRFAYWLLRSALGR